MVKILLPNVANGGGLRCETIHRENLQRGELGKRKDGPLTPLSGSCVCMVSLSNDLKSYLRKRS